jgi:signal transduction histidine kinase
MTVTPLVVGGGRSGRSRRGWQLAAELSRSGHHGGSGRCQVANLPDESLVTLARQLALAEIFAAYLHEEGNALSVLSASFSSLVHEMRTKSSEKHLGIAADLDRLQERNRTVQGLRNDSKASQPLEKAVQRAVSVVSASVHDKRVRLDVHVTPLAAQKAIPASSSTVITHFLLNALAATPPLGRIRLDADVQESVVEIAVTDSGPGIPIALRQEIWEPFATNSGSHTGVGLWFCREWAKSVGATIALDSSYTRGARFVVRVPLGG